MRDEHEKDLNERQLYQSIPMHYAALSEALGVPEQVAGVMPLFTSVADSVTWCLVWVMEGAAMPLYGEDTPRIIRSRVPLAELLTLVEPFGQLWSAIYLDDLVGLDASGQWVEAIAKAAAVGASLRIAYAKPGHDPEWRHIGSITVPASGVRISCEDLEKEAPRSFVLARVVGVASS